MFSCWFVGFISLDISSVFTGSYRQFSLCFSDVYKFRMFFTSYSINHVFGLTIDWGIDCVNLTSLLAFMFCDRSLDVVVNTEGTWVSTVFEAVLVTFCYSIRCSFGGDFGSY